MNRAWLGLAAVAAASALVLAACGGGGSSSKTPTVAPARPAATAAPTTAPTEAAATAATTPAAGGGTTQGSTATITAKDVAFDKSELALKAGDVAITFQNQDTGVPHNFAIYQDQGYTQKVASTNMATGPDTQDLKTTLQAGTYYFRCDVHPTQMTGTIAVQ